MDEEKEIGTCQSEIKDEINTQNLIEKKYLFRDNDDDLHTVDER